MCYYKLLFLPLDCRVADWFLWLWRRDASDILPGVQWEDKSCPREQPREKELALLGYFQASHSDKCVQCVTPFTCETRKSNCSYSVCPHMGLVFGFLCNCLLFVFQIFTCHKLFQTRALEVRLNSSPSLKQISQNLLLYSSRKEKSL